MSKLRFKIVDGRAEIYARRIDTGKWALFGTCHPETARLIKLEGIRKYLPLIHVARNL